jgi:hypothetical protein
MNGLQEQADNAKARDLFWKPLSASGRFPLSSGTITARLLSAAEKNTATTQCEFFFSHHMVCVFLCFM